MHEVDGVRHTLEDWAKTMGIAKSTLHYRLSKGLTMADAIAKSGKSVSTAKAEVDLKEAASGASTPVETGDKVEE